MHSIAADPAITPEYLLTFMKIPLLFTLALCTLLAPAAPLRAAPKEKKTVEEKMAKMLSTKEGRMAALHELMSTKERKAEIAKVLKADPEFREVYGNATTGGG